MFTAKLYNKTGFNLVNIPDSPTLLETAAESTKEVPTMDILQLYFNSVITIRAFEIDVMKADYLELSGRLTDDIIHKAYYYIDGYTMTSGDTVELSVVMEPWLTCGGIGHVKFLDGITNRHHVGRSDDEFGQYQEEDDIFVPSEPVDIVEVDRLFDPTNTTAYRDGSGYALVVLSSTDLTMAKNYKYDVWASADESGGKVGSMQYGGTFAEWGGGDRFNPEQLLSTHRTFCGNPFVVTVGKDDTAVNSIMEKVVDIFANGAGSVISYMYLIPLQYAGFLQNGVNDLMRNTVEFEEFEFEINKNNIKNIRVYGGPENSEIFLSTASGVVKEIRIDHITASEEEVDNVITFKSNISAFADVRPGGGITYEFQEKTTPSSIMEGGKWMEMTSAVTSADGINQARAQFEANRTLSNMSYGAEAMQGIDPGANKLIPYVGLHLVPHKYITEGAKSLYANFENTTMANRFGYTQNGRPALDVMDLNAGDLMSGIKAGDEKAMSAYTRQLQLQNEMSQFNAGVVLNGHVMGDIKSVPDTSCHEVIHYKKRLSARDRVKFDKILTMYGYRHTAPINSLTNSNILGNREKFNFIQTKGVSISTTSNVPKSVRDRACEAFNSGVRIWHVKPDVNAYSNNPYHGV